ncbi:hypothetical protein SADUNF_Sadunf19G0027900 [Salix dunnii]|uniref:Uncharacterized protein n=1 Tax=Salix dunnii TaxID=1413687 RepID=A0A835J1M7_9ROSI|nr:hypothetical protein SADUNF_Sadunf19G0027900 [Salix dunnii]
MEGVPLSSMDDAVNQLDLETFNMSELPWLPPEVVPVNQRFMLCNDQGGQNMVVDNDVINVSFQQTTQFPPSVPQTMVTTHALFISSAEIMGVWSSLEEVLVNQSSTGQNMLVDNNDSTQQTTQFPPHNHQVSGDHDLLNLNCYDSTFFEPTSSSRVQREDQVVEAEVGEERISSHAVAGNDIVSMTGMRAQEDRVFEGALESRLMTEPLDRAFEQSNLAGTAGRTQVGVQGTEQGAWEERIQSHSQAENAMEDTGEGSFRHDAFQTIPRTEQVQHLERRSSWDAGRMQEGVQVMENTVTLGVDAHESRGEAAQGIDLVGQLVDGRRG